MVNSSFQLILPDWMCKKKQTNLQYNLAICQHRLENSQCAANYHELLLEVTYIKLCRPTVTLLHWLTTTNENTPMGEVTMAVNDSDILMDLS